MLDEDAMEQMIPNFKLKSTKKREPIGIKFDYIDWTDQQIKAKVEKKNNNFGDYLKKLLKVIPCDYIDPKPFGQIYPVNTSRQYDIVLYAAIYRKYLSPNVGAEAGTESDPRPKVGMISINLAQDTIKDNPTISIKDGKRLLFNILLHEVFHVLGIEPGHYTHYVNPSTGKIYSKDFPVRDYTLPGKKHK